MKAIISGASRGIGKACALALADAGYDLCLISRSRKDLDDLKSLIEKENKVSVKLIALDLTDFERIGSMDWGSLCGSDEKLVLVNNLGVYAKDEASKVSIAEIEVGLRLNLASAVALSQNIIPSMKKANAGLIINVNSVNGLHSDQTSASYSISKHALKGWSDALREELRKSGIKVTSIYPGAVNTSSWDGLSVDRQRMIQAEDIAQLIVAIGELSVHALVEEIRIDPMDFSH